MSRRSTDLAQAAGAIGAMAFISTAYHSGIVAGTTGLVLSAWVGYGFGYMLAQAARRVRFAFRYA